MALSCVLSAVFLVCFIQGYAMNISSTHSMNASRKHARLNSSTLMFHRRQNGFGGFGLAIAVGSVDDDGSGVGCNDDICFCQSQTDCDRYEVMVERFSLRCYLERMRQKQPRCSIIMSPRGFGVCFSF